MCLECATPQRIFLVLDPCSCITPRKKVQKVKPKMLIVLSIICTLYSPIKLDEFKSNLVCTSLMYILKSWKTIVNVILSNMGSYIITEFLYTFLMAIAMQRYTKLLRSKGQSSLLVIFCYSTQRRHNVAATSL